MFLRVTCFLLVISLYLTTVCCGEKGCVRLEKLFNEICKEGGERKDQIMSKAAKCYVGMLPVDADKVRQINRLSLTICQVGLSD